MRDAVIEAATSNMMLTWLFFSFTFTAQLKDELCKKVHYLSLGSNKDAAAFSSETPLWCLRWIWKPLWSVRAAFYVYICVEALQWCRMLHRWQENLDSCGMPRHPAWSSGVPRKCHAPLRSRDLQILIGHLHAEKLTRIQQIATRL